MAVQLRRSLGISRSLVTLAVLQLVATGTQAVPAPAGSTVPLVGTSLAARPEFAGAVALEAFRPFAIENGDGIVLEGTLHDRVRVSAQTGRPIYERRLIQLEDFGSGYRVVAYSIRGFSFAAQPGFVEVDLDYRTDGPGTAAPGAASREDMDGISPHTFDFSASPVGSGIDSVFTVNITRRTPFGDCCGSMEITATDGSDNARAFLTAFAAAPEPGATAALLTACALGGARLLGTRGRRAPASCQRASGAPRRPGPVAPCARYPATRPGSTRPGRASV